MLEAGSLGGTVDLKVAGCGYLNQSLACLVFSIQCCLEFRVQDQTIRTWTGMIEETVLWLLGLSCRRS